MTHQPSKSDEDYVNEFAKVFPSLWKPSTDDNISITTCEKEVQYWLLTTLKAVRESERERIMSMSERLYGDDRRGHFEDVIAVRVSKI